MLTKKYLEIFLGFAVIILVIFIIFYVFRLNTMVGNKNSYSLKAQFKNISGINPGSEITISGVKVGKVYSIDLNQDDYYQVTVTMNINNNVKIPQNSLAIISSNSLLSENKYIKIEPMEYDGNNFLKNGDKINITQSSINILDMIVQNFLPK